MRAAIGLVGFCLACGSPAVPPPKVAPAEAAATLPPVQNDMPAPAGTLRRSEIREALSAGLGAFLQYVSFDVDHPVFRDHRFVGFRITELKGAGWHGIDLKPGDVVTAVNGFPIEHPEQAQQAFLSLAVASELRVDYERDGKPRSMRLAISDN
jgi:type II secretory pathway component PulC